MIDTASASCCCTALEVVHIKSTMWVLMRSRSDSGMGISSSVGDHFFFTMFLNRTEADCLTAMSWGVEDSDIALISSRITIPKPGLSCKSEIMFSPDDKISFRGELCVHANLLFWSGHWAKELATAPLVPCATFGDQLAFEIRLRNGFCG